MFVAIVEFEAERFAGLVTSFYFFLGCLAAKAEAPLYLNAEVFVGLLVDCGLAAIFRGQS